MENVIALLLLLFLTWVKGSAPAEHPRRHARAPQAEASARVGRAEGSCESMADCAWGYTCEAGRCAEAECHGAGRVGGRAVPARRCGEGLACGYEDGAAAAHGAGVCEAR